MYEFIIDYEGMHEIKHIVTESFEMAYEYANKIRKKDMTVVSIRRGQKFDNVITKTHPM